MSESMSPGVSEIAWDLNPERMADALMDSDAGPVVAEWAKGLERAFFTKTAELSEEERTRRENMTPKGRVRDEIARRLRRHKP